MDKQRSLIVKYSVCIPKAVTHALSLKWQQTMTICWMLYY